jgi:GntR family transcriptional repressor for pyruvate dehydrogenase complex
MRHSLADELTDELVERIVDGRYPPGTTLPPEAELAREADISRLTVREAIKTLRAKNLVRVERGRGTFVNPPEEWTALDALVRATVQTATHRTLPERLIEARRIVEVGAAELAAERRSGEEIARLEEHVAAMHAAHHARDVDAFVAADLAFHKTVLEAARNGLIAALLDPLSQLLVPARRQTSEIDAIRAHALEHHTAILEAIRSGDPQHARRAMHDHIHQTHDDLRSYVLESPASQPAG